MDWQIFETVDSLGLIATTVTNGGGLTVEFLGKYGKYFDWEGISIDISSDMTEKMLGRGDGALIVGNSLRLLSRVGYRS